MCVENIVKDVIKRYFETQGISYDNSEDFDSWLFQYFNFHFKYIHKKPREVELSTELKESSLYVEYQAILSIIESKIKDGDNLNPYQSKNLIKADYDDGLFNDWGIHHLHLGIKKDDRMPYFIARSDKLLFVRFEKNKAYLIGVFSHNERELWSMRDLIRIMRNNWPSLIKDKELGMPFEPELNDKELGIWRKKGFLCGFNVDGMGYILVGDGQSSSGINMKAIRWSHEFKRWLSQNIKLRQDNETDFLEELNKKLFFSK
ncbi:MAG: hypothetical protein JEZ03_01625 [Bacteroidales bacterium]|nr:hypothetical protein [Bacteroidales bacterium]